MENVSVLVAVYNAEKTLSRCLDSLLAQTLEGVQIICIDDASTDSSLAILNDYKARHNNISVVALPANQGQPYARNQGIPLIKAPLTAFLDSDDYMAPDTLEKAVRVFDLHPETDCVLLNVRYIYPDGHEHGYRTPPFDRLSGYEAFLKALQWDVHGWYVARTALYQQYPFDESCHGYSDDNVTMAHYLHSREVRCCEGRYYFTQNDNSCTHQATTRRFDWVKANMSMRRQLLDWGMKREVLDIYEKHRWLVLIDSFWFYHRNKHSFDPAERKYALNTLRTAWQDIDTTTCLPPAIKYKPGYMPLKGAWTLFRWQEWCLYMIRKIKCYQNGSRRK